MFYLKQKITAEFLYDTYYCLIRSNRINSHKTLVEI